LSSDSLRLGLTHPGSFGWLLLAATLSACSSRSIERESLDRIDEPLDLAEEVPGRALLVGIDRYASPEMPPLEGPSNDVRTMRRLLTGRFGFDPARVETLENEGATRNAILEALQRQVAAVAPEEVLVLFFAGHGSRVRDKNGDEALEGDATDEWDESFVPHDARVNGVADILDDELGMILDGLDRANAVVILDCCYSGTGTREPGRSRGVAPDPVPSTSALPTTDLTARVAMDERHVLLSAASGNQRSKEGSIDGRQQGLFTYALGQALANADVDTPLFELMDGFVGPELRTLRDRLSLDQLPTPQLEAPPELWERPLFRADRAQARLPWFEARIESDGSVLLPGAARETLVGSMWALHESSDLDFDPSQSLGIAHAVALEGDDARLELAPGEQVQETRARAVLMAHPQPDPTALFLADELTHARLASALSEYLPGVRLADRESDADWTIADNEGGFQLSRADGLELAVRPDASDPDPIEEIGTFLRRAELIELLNGLDRPSSELHVELLLATEDRPTPESRSRGLNFDALGLPTLRVFSEGDSASLRNNLVVVTRARRDCYLTLVDVDGEGGVSVLFPNARSEEAGFLPAGSLEPMTWTRIPSGMGGPQSGFRWTVGLPVGLETVIAVATSDLQAARSVRELLGQLPTGSAGLPEVRAMFLALRAKLLARARETDCSVAAVSFVVKNKE